MASNGKTICVDFDNVICQSVYPGLGPLIDGAKEALDVFKALGFTIIISSCRSCSWNWDQHYAGQPLTHASERKVHQDMVQFLTDNHIAYDVIDDGTKGKVSADYYIDDKGVRFSNNWKDLAFMIHQAEATERLQAQQAQGAGQARR